MIERWCSFVLEDNMINQTILENQLSNDSRHKVRFSYEVFYSPDDFSFFRKVLVDDKETKLSVNLQSLYDAEKNGTLQEKYEELAKQINQYLIIKR